MTAYINPPYGNDATGIVGSRAKPFKTHAAAYAALEALPNPDGIEGAVAGHRLTETWQELPVETEPPSEG